MVRCHALIQLLSSIKPGSHGRRSINKRISAGAVCHNSNPTPQTGRLESIRGTHDFTYHPWFADQSKTDVAVAPEGIDQHGTAILGKTHVIEVPISALQVSSDSGFELNPDMLSSPGITRPYGGHVQVA